MAGMQGAYSSFFGPDPINLLGVVILTSLGTWGLPQMVTKFYTIKDERSIKSGTVVSTVFAFVVAGGCYFLGGFGRLFVEMGADSKPVEGYDSVIPAMLQNLPELLIGIVVVLVLSASMSTLSSLVLTSSSSITLDLIKPFVKNVSYFFGRIIFVGVIYFNIHIKVKTGVRVSVTGYHISFATSHKMILKSKIISDFIL